ncbi:MAG TPA: hypothetical protein VGN05_02765 [Parvibaculum sp.]|jgi:hypothetical protein
MRSDGADPSEDVKQKALCGAITVHHNHLSQESLSFPDWYGLATLFYESFAHCRDETSYWGRVLDKRKITEIRQNNHQALEMNATNLLFSILTNNNTPNPSDIATFFRKEVFNRAMRIQAIVEYEYKWGTPSHTNPVTCDNTSVAGLGTRLNNFIDQAATELARVI